MIVYDLRASPLDLRVSLLLLLVLWRLGLTRLVALSLVTVALMTLLASRVQNTRTARRRVHSLLLLLVSRLYLIGGRVLRVLRMA